ncbi:MAG: VOC family protein [Planctomycetota bacterium]
MPTPGSLHHVELYVDSLETSRAFWEPFLSHFGYRVSQSWDEGISLQLGDTYLVLVQVEENHKSPTYHRKKVGLNHLAFHAESREQVDELTEWMKEHGHAVLYPDRHPFAGGPEYYALFCEDPNRLKVEVVAP